MTVGWKILSSPVESDLSASIMNDNGEIDLILPIDGI